MKVSICMITYNHEKFIAEAIEGVLMQEADFDYELVIGEDCSIDNTRSIILDYKSKYPDKIKLLLPDKNLGMMPNLIATLQACGGEFIAFCEGDDYWVDPFKLQKEVDFLEVNQEYSAFFTKIEAIKSGKHEYYFPDIETERTFYIQDLIPEWIIGTCSLLFRRSMLFDTSLLRYTKAGDQALSLILASQGPFFYSPEIRTHYRLHEGGITSSKNIDWGQEIFDLLVNFNLLTNYKYKKVVQKRIFNILNNKLENTNKLPLSLNKIKYRLVLFKNLFKHCPREFFNRKGFLKFSLFK